MIDDAESGEAYLRPRPVMVKAIQARIEVRAQRRAEFAKLRETPAFTRDGVKIIVTDDGRGFGFTGRYEHDALVVRQIGPWSLKQRAAALGGRIAIQSGLGRTVVEVRVPIRTAREGVR